MTPEAKAILKEAQQLAAWAKANGMIREAVATPAPPEFGKAAPKKRQEVEVVCPKCHQRTVVYQQFGTWLFTEHRLEDGRRCKMSEKPIP